MPSPNVRTTLELWIQKSNSAQSKKARLNEIIDNGQQGFITFLDIHQQDLESQIQAIINWETSNTGGSTLNKILTRETTTAIEQMVKFLDKIKTDIKDRILSKEQDLYHGRHQERNHQTPK